MAKQNPKTNRSAWLRAGLTLLLLAAAVYVLIAHWSTVHRSLHIAAGASIPWLVISVVLMVFTFLLAAGIYGRLALHPLRFQQTVLIEVSTAFVNRLLPSGLGGLGLHGVYLYKRKHTVAEATAIVSVNNLLGMAAHIFLLLLVAVFRPHVFTELWSGHGFAIGWQVPLIIAGLLVVLLVIRPVRARIRKFLQNLVKSLRNIRIQHLVQALLLAMVLTTTYTVILDSSARSIGIHLSIIQVFIVFSIGMLTSTATPTPGGLVGAEAGLFAGFVAYGVSSPLAGAAVLLFRLVTYWLPLVPGLLALGLARRNKLV